MSKQCFWVRGENMGSIRKEFVVDADTAKVWAAVRDFGAVHERLAKGFVTDCKLDSGARIVTFFNGRSAREALVDLDDTQCRLVYSATGSVASHHNASAQLFEEGAAKTRFVWITDILPNELVAPVAAMMEQGAAAMKKTLES